MRTFVLGVCAIVMSVLSAQRSAIAEGNQFFEFRQYQMDSEQAANDFDDYVARALIPALNRAGCNPVGYFKTTDEQTSGVRYMLVPYSSLNAIADVKQKLAGDEDYQTAFKQYSGRDAKEVGLTRYRTELLHAFDCFPKVAVPALASGNQSRLFELRTYESATEYLGNLKVEMFNAGEVPIFLECGIAPVFMGQALAGDRQPNLTYMTVYPDAATRDAAWVKFRENANWKKLSGDPKWKNTVSKIHKTDLVAVKGSQL